MTSARDAFFQTIFKLIDSGEDIVVITPDLGAPSLDDFRKKYPERYISVGIAEQNLISVAAGLALTGKKVVAYGLGPFPVTRGFDQIRCLLAELNIPLTLCSLNAGFCSAEAGYTHMPIEDFGMVRMLANIQMYNPSDETISRKLANDILISQKPRYIRFDKAVQGSIYSETEIKDNYGYTIYGEQGGATVGIVTFGCYVAPMREFVDYFLQNDKKVKLIDMYCLSINVDGLLEQLKLCEKIITIEENVLPGGLGSYILELLSDQELYIPVKRMGYDISNGYFQVYVNRNYIREHQGLDLKNIKNIINNAIDEV